MSRVPPPDTVPTLRERARFAMRAEVEAVAFELFLEHGYEQTSVEQITTRSGISRSSFFRYFPTKEDLVVGSLADWGFAILDALHARPDTESIWASLEHSLEPVVAATVADPVGTRRISKMIYDTSALQARRYVKTLHWQALLIPEVSRRLGISESDRSDPRPRALVAAMLDCFTAATICWANDDTLDDLGGLVSTAMNSLHR